MGMGMGMRVLLILKVNNKDICRVNFLIFFGPTFGSKHQLYYYPLKNIHNLFYTHMWFHFSFRIAKHFHWSCYDLVFTHMFVGSKTKFSFPKRKFDRVSHPGFWRQTDFSPNFFFLKFRSLDLNSRKGNSIGSATPVFHYISIAPVLRFSCVTTHPLDISSENRSLEKSLYLFFYDYYFIKWNIPFYILKLWLPP
jgi:hypothetical protein